MFDWRSLDFAKCFENTEKFLSALEHVTHPHGFVWVCHAIGVQEDKLSHGGIGPPVKSRGVHHVTVKRGIIGQALEPLTRSGVD